MQGARSRVSSAVSGPLVENDIDGNPFRLQPVKILLKLGRYRSVLLLERTNSLIVAVALKRQDFLRQCVHPRLEFREVDAVFAGRRVARERALLLKEVERGNVRAAMRISAAEADRAEETREEAHVVRANIFALELALLVQLLHHVQTENVRLPFLERAVALLDRCADSSLSI